MVHKPLGLLAELTHRCPLGCPYCDHTAAVRDFLSLASPTRPARVAVRVVHY